MHTNFIKKWWFWLIFIIFVIGFFYPKPAGHSGPGFPPANGSTWADKECSCLGYKGLGREFGFPEATDTGQDYWCAGIPYSCGCIEQTYHSKILGETSKEITCPQYLRYRGLNFSHFFATTYTLLFHLILLLKNMFIR